MSDVTLSPEQHAELLRVCAEGATNAETLARVCQALELPDTADGDQIVGAIEDLQAAIKHLRRES